MSEKRYYWLKLRRDFFKRHDIQIVEAMPNGKDYVLYYLKLLVESVDHEGSLRFSDTIPYDEQMLSVITNTNIDVVRCANKVFMTLGLLEVADDKTIYMEEAAKMLGSESWSAERVRRHRDRITSDTGPNEPSEPLINALHCNNDVTSCNQEIEIEKEIEIDKESRAQKRPTQRFIKPTVDEIKAYCQERKNGIDAQHFFDWYETKGWMVGKNKMKDWKAAVRTWESRDAERGQARQTKSIAERIAEL